MRKHFMYGAWAGMVNRCHNPNNSSFARYGGRGTTVCDRWRKGEGGKSGFECFLADMGERPHGKTLDREDASGNYEPGNCRWADASTQRRNMSARGKAEALRKGSEARTAYWAEWRKSHNQRPDIGPRAETNLAAIQSSPAAPTDGRVRKCFRRLVSLGLASEADGYFSITDMGSQWLRGGRPNLRSALRSDEPAKRNGRRTL